MDNPKLFVSYASEDRSVALEIGRLLREKMGIDAFVDFWEIRPGDDFVSKLNEGLAQADHFVLILSPASVQKPWPLAEQSVATLRAIEDRARIIPVNLGLANQEVPPLLRRLSRIDMSSGDVSRVTDEIASIVFGISSTPPLSAPPEYAADQAFLSIPQLRPVDRTVLGALFSCGKNSIFRPDVGEIERRVAEAGVSTAQLDESLEFLRELHLVTFQRGPFGGAVQDLLLRPTAAEACCAELVPDYLDHKRSILAAAVNELHGTSSDRLAEQTGQESWLVCHVLRWAEERGLVKMHPVYLGHDFLSVTWVSPGLRRQLQDL